MTPWSPTSSRIFGLLGGGLIWAFSLAARSPSWLVDEFSHVSWGGSVPGRWMG